MTMPILIKFANHATIYADPCERSSHDKKVPNLGGIGIFLGIVFSMLLLTPNKLFSGLQYILATQFIIFFLGLKDDIFILSAKNKLIIQIACALILIVLSGARITSFYGTLGIYELTDTQSYIFSIITIVGLVNAFNLIDGINWLAGLISISAATFLSIWFITNGFIIFAGLSLAIIGSVIAFLIYNKTPARIFMGDTGSLLLGLTLTFLIIKFINLNHTLPNLKFQLRSAPSMAVSIFFIPILDTLRVFLIRIKEKRSPLSPDKNHLHHILLDANFTHLQAALSLFFINSACIIISLILNRFTGKIIIPLLFVFSFSLINVFIFSRVKKKSLNLVIN
ncbi:MULTISPECIES: MraY family glycosyltransferase [Halobacteriovorax]|nr:MULTISPECIES: MraY family glycosyltransferase [Halobacteriovorax]